MSFQRGKKTRHRDLNDSAFLEKFPLFFQSVSGVYPTFLGNDSKKNPENISEKKGLLSFTLKLKTMIST